MRPAARITTAALRHLDAGHSQVMAFALAVVAHPCSPASQHLALLTFTAAVRRRRAA